MVVGKIQTRALPTPSIARRSFTSTPPSQSRLRSAILDFVPAGGDLAVSRFPFGMERIYRWVVGWSRWLTNGAIRSHAIPCEPETVRANLVAAGKPAGTKSRIADLNGDWLGGAEVELQRASDAVGSAPV